MLRNDLSTTCVSSRFQPHAGRHTMPSILESRWLRRSQGSFKSVPIRRRSGTPRSSKLMKIIMRKLIREPLFHFLLLGAVIFLLAGRVRGGRVGSGDKIVVTQSGIESMVVGFSRTWMRPPTQEELRGLVDDFVREEVLYREAKAMGLDQDDVIVRRRMRQKFEFLAEDLAARTGPPTDQELQAYLRQHADRYSEEPRFGFEQIFFSREKRGASAEAEATAMLVRLRGKSTIDMEKLGDAFLLPSQFEKT